MDSFLKLNFLLFKCLLIVLVLQGASVRDFTIFMFPKFSCLLREQFFAWIVVIIFLTCQSVFLFHTFQVVADNGFTASKGLRNFFLRFSDSPFSNSDNLVIYVLVFLSITVLIAFILRRLYIIIFSIKLSPVFFSFYWLSCSYVENK